MEASPILAPVAVDTPSTDQPFPHPARRASDKAPAMPLLTKEQVARHYSFSTRWVELQLAKGMPSRMIGGRRRFDLGAVDRWLRATYGDR